MADQSTKRRSKPPSDYPWVAVPPDLLRDIRADGFFVHQGTDGVYAVLATFDHPHNLMRMRVRQDGSWEAHVSGNSGFGKTRAFKEAARRATAGIAGGLSATSRTKDNAHVIAALRSARTQLLRGEKKFAKAPDPFSRAGSHKFWQGGAPGLGKRS